MTRSLIVGLVVAILAPAQTPSPAYAAYERANALFTRQQFQASFDAVEEALRLDPKLLPALTLRAKLALAAKRHDLARIDLEHAVSSHPRSAYAQFLLGLVLYEQNELQLARKPLESALTLNPKDSRTPLYLGLVSESLGETARAAELYRRAIQLEQDAGQPQVETCLIAARLQLVLDQVEKAAALVVQALRVDPSSRDAHFESARIAIRRGRHADAATAAEKALSFKGGETTDARIHALLARVYQARGDAERAARHAAAARGN